MNDEEIAFTALRGAVDEFANMRESEDLTPAELQAGAAHIVEVFGAWMQTMGKALTWEYGTDEALGPRPEPVFHADDVRWGSWDPVTKTQAGTP